MKTKHLSNIIAAAITLVVSILPAPDAHAADTPYRSYTLYDAQGHGVGSVNYDSWHPAGSPSGTSAIVNDGTLMGVIDSPYITYIENTADEDGYTPAQSTLDSHTTPINRTFTIRILTPGSNDVGTAKEYITLFYGPDLVIGEEYTVNIYDNFTNELLESIKKTVSPSKLKSTYLGNGIYRAEAASGAVPAIWIKLQKYAGTGTTSGYYSFVHNNDAHAIRIQITKKQPQEISLSQTSYSKTYNQSSFNLGATVSSS